MRSKVLRGLRSGLIRGCPVKPGKGPAPLLPLPYTGDYTITATLADRVGTPVRTYQRKATLKNWTQALLIFVYPFHPLEGKREEIYAESLHDIFRQIETEKVLKRR